MSKRLTLLPGIALILILFLIPVGIVFQQGLFDPAFTIEHFIRFATRGAYMRIFWNTLQVSAVVALACLLIGYPIAYFIVRQPTARRPFLMFLVLVPMWMSILARTYAWMVVLGKEGIINQTLIALGIIDTPIQMLFTTGAVYVGMVQIMLPILIVTCFSSMTEIDQSLLRAARIMGASPRKAFREVFLPLSAEGAITGTLIVFILSMGFFIVPALIGGRKDTMMANVISGQVSQTNWGFAAALAIVLLAATLLILTLVRGASAKLVHHHEEAH
ncbi:ABC transporter permease [Phaeobacter gallaeciensis]|uniref:ABC transporter permease n=2 Tax=Roseobacteraceae TaxID=2854170 RepID=A0A366X3V0_9RHOB|nr:MULTISPECIES: ABC transporter permease [Roseobacteraceae]MBT3143208.1 ABC transporter permease [Falsiruegeria litorea]MBT8167613.1 ABC transporter permease [Falsiruegeria litorea]RBW57992.1 ABC transporter permease [Phaeobacter gallaeciensis]